MSKLIKGRFLVVISLVLPSFLHASVLEQFEIALAKDGVFLPLILAGFAGFLSSLSPCVYPLIPITLSVMGAKKEQKGFLKALTYTLGLALVYSVLGLTFASLGILSGSLMQHPAFLLLLALFLTLMSLSMFGVFSIVLPQKLVAKLTRLKSQGYKGAFLMGMMAGVVAAPCTGPVLGVILAIIAEQKNITLGLGLMLSFSLGMGAPFLALGTFSKAILHLPKSGPWMDRIKFILGSLTFGVALYYLGQAWPFFRMGEQITNSGVILVFGLLLMSIQMFKHQALHGVQVILAILMISSSTASMLFYEEPKVYSTKALSWHVIDEQTKDFGTLDRLLKKAESENKPVLIDFYADWCQACIELERYTFSEQGVSHELSSWILVRIDATKSSDYLSALQNRYQILGLPTMVLMGLGQKSEKIVGFIASEPFFRKLKNLSKMD
jgi:thiol:disulfide interchange protein DsbD